MSIRWVSVFLDVPPDLLEASASFWTAATCSTLGEPVGERGEFLPLEPPAGHPCLWLQRTQDGPVGVHPDLYVADLDAAAVRAQGLGATVVDRRTDLVVARSPGGLPFCLVRHRDEATRPEPFGPAGARSIVDQVCLDIPPAAYDAECAFWRDLTGWTHTDGGVHDEFSRLVRPEEQPFAFLLQRLADEAPTVTAHLDWAADDREAETDRHVALGARVVRRAQGWTVFQDPAGCAYCITARRPGDV